MAPLAARQTAVGRFNRMDKLVWQEPTEWHTFPRTPLDTFVMLSIDNDILEEWQEATQTDTKESWQEYATFLENTIVKFVHQQVETV